MFPPQFLSFFSTVFHQVVFGVTYFPFPVRCPYQSRQAVAVFFLSEYAHVRPNSTVIVIIVVIILFTVPLNQPRATGPLTAVWNCWTANWRSRSSSLEPSQTYSRHRKSTATKTLNCGNISAMDTILWNTYVLQLTHVNDSISIATPSMPSTPSRTVIHSLVVPGHRHVGTHYQIQKPAPQKPKTLSKCQANTTKQQSLYAQPGLFDSLGVLANILHKIRHSYTLNKAAFTKRCVATMTWFST